MKFKVIDLFCGAGGTSLGFDRATVNGHKIAEVVACVNHDALAIRSHEANFPQCRHFVEDVRTLDVTTLPRKEKGDKSVWILWASLECTHFSNAKTGARNADSRTLAHALFPYIDWIKPDLVMIENVREFMSWGELCEKGKPIDRKKGIHYVKWREKVESMGYRYASRLLNSADFGAHQSRLRYFGVFAKPGIPLVFPMPTHDRYSRHGLEKWRPVREVLDLNDVGESIFSRKKPLSPNTLKRILAGLVKFVANGQPNYLVKNYGGDPAHKVVSLDGPAPTVTTIPHEMLVSADFMVQYNGRPDKSIFPTDEPCHTVTTRDRFGRVQVNFIDNQFGQGKPSSIDEPAGALTTVPKRNLVSASFLMPTNYGNEPVSLEGPSPVLTANRKWHYLVNPQFNSAGGSIDAPAFTLIAKMDKRPPSIVTVEGREMSDKSLISAEFFKDETVPPETRILAFMEVYGIRDIYMRMLSIPELKNIQGLTKHGGKDYVLMGPKDQQKKFIGNAVVPDVVEQWIKAYHRELTLPEESRNGMAPLSGYNLFTAVSV